MEKKMKVRVGVAVVAETFAQPEYNNRILKSAGALSGKLDGVTVTLYPEVISGRHQSKKAGREFREKGMDIIVLFMATYSQDNLLIDLVYPSDCGVFLWAAPEPLEYPWPEIGAFCGLTQVGGIFSKLEKSFTTGYGAIDDTAVIGELQQFIEIGRLKKRLRYASVGLVGTRSDGMVENVFNEFELRRQVGPEVVPISLHVFFERFKALSDNDIWKKFGSELEGEKFSKISTEQVMEAFKIYEVLRGFAEERKLDGLSIRCWPELRAYGVASPCFALSRLHDEGIVTACEADVTALVTMMIGDALSGTQSVLTDLMKIDDDEDLLYYYHCGAAGSSLCTPGFTLEYDIHPVKEVWKPGVIVQFPVKPGRVVCARLGERDGRHKIVAYTGEALETDLFVMGNTLKIKGDKKPSYIVEKLIEYGTEHHQVTFYSETAEQLERFCVYSDIPLYMI
jgi:L-fucose isomerase-like protein